MKNIFKKIIGLIHLKHEKPWKRVLLILLPFVAAGLIILISEAGTGRIISFFNLKLPVTAQLKLLPKGEYVDREHNNAIIVNESNFDYASQPIIQPKKDIANTAKPEEQEDLGLMPDGTFKKSNGSSYLTYEKAVFARVPDEGDIIFLEKPEYVRGEPIHFALMNVGKFKKDAEGKNWVDMDLVVIDPDGNIAIQKQHLLGDGGHRVLENDTAPSPDGVYFPVKSVKTGTYKISLRVYDRIGGGEVSDSGTFLLK